MPLNFLVTDADLNLIDDWRTEHLNTCTLVDPGVDNTARQVGAIGGAETYEFTGTGLGTICKISCACGESFDFTDYASW